MGDRTAIESEVIDTGFLKNFLKLKECRQRCEKLLQNPPEWLDETGLKALTITVNSIKPSGQPIDHWAERVGSKPKKKRRKKKKTTSPNNAANNTEN